MVRVKILIPASGGPTGCFVCYGVAVNCACSCSLEYCLIVVILMLHCASDDGLLRYVLFCQPLPMKLVEMYHISGSGWLSIRPFLLPRYPVLGHLVPETGFLNRIMVIAQI